MARVRVGVRVRVRVALPVVLALVAHCLAREADRALGLLLRAEVEWRSLPAELLRAALADAGGAALRVLAWLALGLAAWLALACWRARRERLPLGPALEQETGSAVFLWLRPALTLLALVSVALRWSYPYAFTLPVALTQDWSLGQDAAALAAFVALRAPALRWPAPRAGEVFLLAFLGYAVLAPNWAWRWEGHPGNEPKYLRQAVALGLFGSFDAEGVSAPMEDLAPRPAIEALGDAVSTLARESRAMLGAVASGRAGRDAIRATRVVRQVIRGKRGGIYYVLAPGPSLLLAPALRADRALNEVHGEKGRVPLSVLLWCALGALLVVALFLLIRDATGRQGLAAALAFGFALAPPFLFYPYQFYPEMLGALVLAVAFRPLALRPELLLRHAAAFGSLVAALPWLHQKFLPVWLVLVATAVIVILRTRASSRTETDGADRVASDAAGQPAASAAAARAHGSPVAASPSRTQPPAAHDDEVRAGSYRLDVRRALRTVLRPLLAFLLPQALSLYLTALYNFAITGSVRPDALFLAWGPGGVSGARVGQGLFGLLLDARFGILPWVPVLLLAAAGLARGGARRFAIVLPSAFVYYLTVASADNWSGAVCNLGRYFMPVAPLAVVLVAIALHRETDAAKPEPARRAALAVFAVLAAWTALFAVLLWYDPQAANDSGLLLAKSTYANGNAYIPNLFFRHWSEAAPGLWARIAAWAAILALTAVGLRAARTPARALGGIALVALALGFGLERWPAPKPRTAPADPAVLPAPDDVRVRFSGQVRVREDEAILGPGEVELLVRSPRPLPTLRATVGGEGLLRLPGGLPFVLRPTGGVVDLPLLTYHGIVGRDGREARFSRLRATVAGQAVIRFGPNAGPSTTTAPAPSASGAGSSEDQPAEPEDPGSR